MPRRLLPRVAALLLAGSTPIAVNAVPVNFLDLGNRLVRVDSAAPGTITGTLALTGIQGNEQLLGIDYRPASSRVLYGVSTAGRTYAINPLTGTATALGAPVTLVGTAAALDFNPSVDRIRLVTNTNQNLRINPDTGGLAGTDVPVFYAAGDSGAGLAPRIVGAAYTNNTPGATPTTLYVLDVARGVLATQGSVGGTVSPNTGQLFTVGATGVVSNDNVGFDIGRDGTVLASFTTPGTGTTSLYSLNLTTGAATLIGQVGSTAGRSYLGLAIAPERIARFGLTANQTAIGNTLDGFVGVPGAGLNALFNSLDGLTADQDDALSQLTPGAYTLLPELTLRTAEFQQDTLQRYLRDVRDGGAGLRTEGDDSRVGGFLIGSGRYGEYDGDVDRAQVDYSAVGGIGGLDFRLMENLVIGAYGGYDSTRARLGGTGQNSKIESYFGGAYATVQYAGAYLDVFGSYGKSDYDLRRSVHFGTTALDFASDTESETYLGGGQVGFKFDLGNFVVEPFAGVRYAKVEIDGFAEGSGIAALTLGDAEYESVLGNFGAKIGAEFEVRGATVRPEIRGAYRREFKEDRSDGFGFFFAGTGSAAPLPFTPNPLKRDYATAGAGVTVSGTGPLSIVLDYTGEFAGDRSINGVSGGLRLAF